MSKYYFILMLSLLLPIWGQSSPPPEILQAEIQELKSVIRSLRAKNELLENRNQQLMLDVVNLGRNIRAMQAQTGVNEGVPRVSAPEAIEKVAVRPGQFKALYVNQTTHYLLVDAGSNQGIALGDTGSIVRDGDIIAKIKISDIKPNQSVADINLSSLAERGFYPRKDDQVTFP